MNDCEKCHVVFVGAKRAFHCADCAYAMPDEPVKTEPTDIVDRLMKASNGYPHANIQWPHYVLHEAADEIRKLRAEVAEGKGLKTENKRLREKSMCTCEGIGADNNCPLHALK